MKKLLKIVMILGLIGLGCLVKSGTASAANDPFVCSSNFYQVISGQLKYLDPLTGSYTNVGSPQADTYNSIGYNSQDNYIYGIKTSVTDSIGAVGNLVRISSDGSLTDLGAITGLPVSGYVNGSTDNAGNLYIHTAIHTVYKVNISTQTATAITTTGDNIVSGDDSVFINNKLYLLVGSTLSIVDLTTNVVSNVTVTGPANWLNAGTDFGAGWADQAGELFFSNNQSGSIYQITDLTSGAPTAVFKVSGTVTSNNDGANCSLAQQNPFDAPIATDDTYTTPFNTPLNETTLPLLTNDNGNILTVTANTNPSHGTVTVSSQGTFVYTSATGFSGTDSFSYTVTDSFGRTATAQVTLTVSPTAAVPGTPDTGYGIGDHTHPMIVGIVGGLLLMLSSGLGFVYMQKRFKTHS